MKPREEIVYVLHWYSHIVIVSHRDLLFSGAGLIDTSQF